MNHDGRVTWVGLVLLTALSGLFLLPEKARAQAAETAPSATPLHWTEPFVRLPARGAYVSMLQRNGGFELWNVAWEGMSKDGSRADHNQLTVARGPSPERLGEETVVQELRPLITDVFDPQDAKALGPWRAMTRPEVLFDAKAGYVLYGCVVPEYRPGSVPLLPAIFTSPSGEPGSWKYLGKLGPEPREESERRKNPVWCDGGGLHRLSDGRWRIYANNYRDNGVSAAEAPALDGPWKFLRDDQNEIRNLTLKYSDATHGTAFPSVLRVSETEWHMWVSNAWPVKEIWHLWSTDGLDWKPYGKQPEVTPHAVGNRDIKCIRAYLDADGKHIVGLLSIFETWKDGEKMWVCYKSRMPIGPPRE